MTEARRYVNERIRDGALRLSLQGEAGLPGDRWEFLCECGDPECKEHVALPLAEFERLLTEGEPVLAEAHTVRRAIAACRRSAELQQDSAALTAQAEQILRRRPRRSG